MSWVSGGDDSKEDPFPVDTLVRDILDDLKQADSACSEHGGNERQCCNIMSACLATFKKKMENIQAQEVDAQNMHRACRNSDAARKSAKKCLTDVNCHRNVIEENLLEPFDKSVANARKTHQKHCKDLPKEETTTTNATTTPASTTSTKPPNKRTTRTTTTTTTPSTTTTTPPTTTTTPTTTPPSTPKAPPITTTTPPTTTTTPVPTPEPVTNTSTTTTTTTTTTTKPPTHSTSPNPPYSTTSPQDPISNITFDSTPGTQTGPPQNGSTNPTEDNEKTTVTDSFTNTDTQTTSNITGDNVTPVVMTVSTPATGTTNQSVSGNEGLTSHPENSDNVLIACAVLGGLLLIVAIVVLLIIKWRKYQASQEGSNGSTSSKAPFIWRWLSTKSSMKTEDTDIYAEIDEAFMEAVYRVDQKKPSKTKRQQSNAQINICYEAGLEDRDAVISGRKSKTTSISEHPEEPHTLEHGDAEVMRDFHTRLSISQSGIVASFPEKKDDKGDRKGKKTKALQGHILSRPAFTDIDYSGDRYEEIASHEDEYVEINEPIYEVPSEVQHTYDSTNFGNFPKSQNQPDPNYSHIHVYKNDISRKRNKSDKNSDERFYENDDSMMEY